MNKNLKLREIVWEIIVPIVLYYIVFLSAMYFIFAFIGHTASTIHDSADNICSNYNTIYVFCKL